ncbi:MAG: SDR family NAD(P)-dependent oxidoreductase [Acidimicrobiales bacterium]|nr:3-oxoacyl-ACP reductase [Acidimicrobiaceae bacterium]MDP6162428.1 SDR family NAD(P)-dependent oxidoreductase [Acidimicrobiales bacterium]MBT69279.1 3-oxoacyl-ACP reductase [Acidimicrobiaceae bacterium]MDP6323627.1 SDR family NAD(P)-dependent oxidoreductase [Acidimicrobiales bacterium]HJL91668.1 SDR family NAD(P)-dependent oxidoreductase [Acidimicrobiales bacterium]
MGELDGRVACVTGGTRGIGRAIAEALLREGASVVINGRSEEKGTVALEEMDAGEKAHFISADVKSREGCEAIVSGTVEKYGKIDILVANAGGASNHAPVAELTDEAMEDSLVWNFWHTFWTMRSALGHMIPQGWGRIIAVSSVEGKVGKPGLAIYVSAKHAINGLVKSSAHEVGTLGITVNAVCPGLIETDIVKEVLPLAAESMGLESYEAALDLFAQESAIKRLNEVEDVAEVCLLLTSEAGAGITGSLISIDGGTAPY